MWQQSVWQRGDRRQQFPCPDIFFMRVQSGGLGKRQGELLAILNSDIKQAVWLNNQDNGVCLPQFS